MQVIFTVLSEFEEKTRNKNKLISYFITNKNLLFITYKIMSRLTWIKDTFWNA